MIRRRNLALLEPQLSPMLWTSIATQETLVSQLLATLRQSQRIELLEVDFPGLVADPIAWLPRIQEFLGGKLTGDLETLAVQW